MMGSNKFYCIKVKSQSATYQYNFDTFSIQEIQSSDIIKPISNCSIYTVDQKGCALCLEGYSHTKDQCIDSKLKP